MTHSIDIEKPNDQASVAHNEYASDHALAVLTAPVRYDNGQLRDITKSPYVFGAALLASFGGFSFGYDQGVISIILVMTQFRQYYPQTHPDSPSYGFHVGFVTAMLELGAFVGCLFFPSVADRISRKWGLTVATVFFVVGAIIQTAALNYDALVAGRFIGGIGVGTLAMGAPLYISEIAPPAWRGSLLVLESISIVVGAIVAYWITYATRSISTDWAFRLPFLLQIFPALVVGCAIHFFPFSPRWLAMRDRNEDSLMSLARLRQRPGHDEQVQHEWKGILSEVRFQREILLLEYPDYTSRPLIAGIRQWIGLFRPKYFRRTLIALAIPFFQQFSGINAFVYYAPTFFEALGQSSDMSLILSGMVNVCQLIGGIPILMFLDRVGRRRLAVLGGLIMAIPHLVMAGLMGKFSGDWASHQAIGWFCVALIYWYVITYAMSYGPLAWVLPAEVFPSSKRAKGVGAATAMIWLSNFIIGVVVPEMLIKLGWGTYLFFGMFCLGAAVFSYIFVPETSNQSLEQVAELFGDNMHGAERDLHCRIAREVLHDPTGNGTPPSGKSSQSAIAN
ncbi:MFS monosaccharide transporter [Aspergillus steynii IBT 23096]|uniref:MFS monosaccharide transporter n=1 Tax=Aspergillus steynii IBT 23096 TaxID=1392250 RepID=A0A2I2G6U5_9EURO|nr:MFS monosaccharide transporter [Aspergillus steynii IBT 23096]PLB48585.1 MFS monosaccharide transporter [Aspergillus steynii IBT 23096]